MAKLIAPWNFFMLRSIHNERKRKFRLMFVVFSLIFFAFSRCVRALRMLIGVILEKQNTRRKHYLFTLVGTIRKSRWILNTTKELTCFAMVAWLHKVYKEIDSNWINLVFFRIISYHLRSPHMQHKSRIFTEVIWKNREIFPF